MINRDTTEQYKKSFPSLEKFYNNKFGEGNWKAFRNSLTGQYGVKPNVEHPNDMTIAETDKRGFVWLRLTNRQALVCIVSELFDVYARYDDESESLVDGLADYMSHKEYGNTFYLEVGHVDPDFFGMEL